MFDNRPVVSDIESLAFRPINDGGLVIVGMAGSMLGIVLGAGKQYISARTIYNECKVDCQDIRIKLLRIELFRFL